jgi:hypothetical protein
MNPEDTADAASAAERLRLYNEFSLAADRGKPASKTMTLRDAFALGALQGILSGRKDDLRYDSLNVLIKIPGGENAWGGQHWLAPYAYMIADAMLEAREETA